MEYEKTGEYTRQQNAEFIELFEFYAANGDAEYQVDKLNYFYIIR